MRPLYTLAIVSILFSCENRSSYKDLVEYSEGRQLLNVNGVKRDGSEFDEPKIKKDGPDSIKVGDELLVKIFLTNTDLAIVDAFVDCDSVANPSVDTVTYKVSGCKDGLIVKEDTILIGFRPSRTGFYAFLPVMILTKDREGVFRTLRYTFDYKVVED